MEHDVASDEGLEWHFASAKARFHNTRIILGSKYGEFIRVHAGGCLPVVFVPSAGSSDSRTLSRFLPPPQDVPVQALILNNSRGRGQTNASRRRHRSPYPFAKVRAISRALAYEQIND